MQQSSTKTSLGEMSYTEIDTVGILRFPKLEQIPFILHAFSTRKGGVSPSPYDTMNLNFGRGDSDGNVTENFRRFCNASHIPYHSLVSSHQTHTANVLRVYASHKGAGIFKERPWENIDGLLTNDPGVTLVTYYADCTPLFFVDPIHHAIGLAHAGWRGTVAGIGIRMVEAMKTEFGSDPTELVAAIGPSIGPCCYEVDEPVMKQFQNAPQADLRPCIQSKENGKYTIDLWQANRLLLQKAGIPAASIYDSKLCTACHSQLLWSHRATGGIRGGMAAMLGIREE